MKCAIFGDFFELQGGYLGVTSDPHIFLLTPPNYVNFFAHVQNDDLYAW